MGIWRKWSLFIASFLVVLLAISYRRQFELQNVIVAVTIILVVLFFERYLMTKYVIKNGQLIIHHHLKRTPIRIKLIERIVLHKSSLYQHADKYEWMDIYYEDEKVMIHSDNIDPLITQLKAENPEVDVIYLHDYQLK